jgi:hypothetical protein
MSSTFKNNGLFPGMKERWDNIAEPTKEHVGSHKKLYKRLAIGGLGLWAVVTYIGPFNDAPAPLGTAGAIAETTGEFAGNIEDFFRGSSPSQAATPPTTEIASESSVVEATLVPITTAPSSNSPLPTINSVPSTTINTVNSPVPLAPETTTAQTQAVFVSGSVACNKIVVATFGTQITADGETRVDYASEAMSSASTAGHKFNQLVPEQAEKIWADVQIQLNGGEVERAVGVTFNSVDECDGLVFLPE